MEVLLCYRLCAAGGIYQQDLAAVAGHESHGGEVGVVIGQEPCGMERVCAAIFLDGVHLALSVQVGTTGGRCQHIVHAVHRVGIEGRCGCCQHYADPLGASVAEKRLDSCIAVAGYGIYHALHDCGICPKQGDAAVLHAGVRDAPCLPQRHECGGAQDLPYAAVSQIMEQSLAHI